MTVMHTGITTADPKLFTPKDPISALTHLIGAVGAVIGMPFLLIEAGSRLNSIGAMISYAVFMMSMIVLYSASTVYHSFSINRKVNTILKKIDHMSIFLLIAGTYTPVAVTVLHGRERLILLSAVWIIAVFGILFKACWVTCPKWVSSVIYIAMGWMILPFTHKIVGGLPQGAFFWLLLGGILYTIGGVIYAVKPKIFDYRISGFGNHELFHCFVLVGSLCHYIFIFNYLTLLG